MNNDELEIRPEEVGSPGPPCPNCGTPSQGTRYCLGCGFDLAATRTGPAQAQPREPWPRAEARPATPPPPPPPARATPEPGRFGETSPRAKYAGASFLVMTLLIMGWLIAALGVIGGILAAANCDQPGSGFFDEGGNCDTDVEVGLFLFVTITTWFMAAFFLWAGYTLRVILDIEARLRRGQGEADG